MPHTRRRSSALLTMVTVCACWLTVMTTPAQAAPPANDARAAAEPLTASLTGRTLSEATTEAGEVLTCGTTAYDSTVWFRYTAPASGSVALRVATVNRMLSVYRASGSRERCGSGTQSLEVLGGEQLLLQIGRTPAATGFNFDFDVTFTPAPANDDLAAAEPLGALTETRELTLYGATPQADEPRSCNGLTIDHTVWFRYTAPARGSLRAALSTRNRTILVRAPSGRDRCAERAVTIDGVGAGEQYLIQVGRQADATSYATKLTVTLQPGAAGATPTPTPAPTPEPTPTPGGAPSLRSMAVVLDYVLASRTRTTTVRRLVVSNVPSGAQLTARCRRPGGGRCRGPAKPVLRRHAGGSVRLRAFERRFPPQTRLEVVVARTGYVTMVKTMRLRRHARPRIATRCIRAPSTRRTAC